MQASTEDTTTYIGAIDAGTTSARFLIFTDKGKLVASHQLEFEQIYPRPGYFVLKRQRTIHVLNVFV